jgi:hypothetical protein
MQRTTLLSCVIALLFGAVTVEPAIAASGATTPASCRTEPAKEFPHRRRGSETGSQFVKEILPVGGMQRDRMVAEQVLRGNVPEFLRNLIPVTLSGTAGNLLVQVTICVTPDYLAVGSDADFVRVPVGLPAAALIATSLGFTLPTRKMVDAIYTQASVKLTPKPMPPTAQMSSTEYFWRHNQTVDGGRAQSDARLGALTAGQKKDIVLSNRLRSSPGRVAIYGWHQPNGRPIQPLSTVHGAGYADYSHGVRLVSSTAFVQGEPRDLGEILQDPELSRIVSDEGPIAEPATLLRSLR